MSSFQHSEASSNAMPKLASEGYPAQSHSSGNLNMQDAMINCWLLTACKIYSDCIHVYIYSWCAKRFMSQLPFPETLCQSNATQSGLTWKTVDASSWLSNQNMSNQSPVTLGACIQALRNGEQVPCRSSIQSVSAWRRQKAKQPIHR